MPSQKPIFAVLGLILTLVISVYSVAFVADVLYFQPAREELRRLSIGASSFECLKSNEVRRELEERKLLSTDSKISALGDELSIARKLSYVIYAGLLYLFSSVIVRTLRKMLMVRADDSAANHTFQRTPDGAAK
jgi:hypothetical protein